MKIPFAKLSPGGNTTILLDMPAPEGAMRAHLANVLMNPLHLGGEQVGFMTMDGSAVPYLEMMGGEFCGNAARSFAAVLVMRGHPALAEDGQSSRYSGEIRVSGANEPVRVDVAVRDVPAVFSADNSGVRKAYDASVRLALPQNTGRLLRHVGTGLDVVALEGITHVLLDAAKHPMPADHVAECSRLRALLELEQEDAVGCVWYARKNGAMQIDPVVWVRETRSTHHETGCGSGSVALGVLETLRTGEGFSALVVQPSGQSIHARIEYYGAAGFGGAWIGGEVRLIAQGETRLY
jgi:diaminopimelate epimerase